MKGYSWTGYRNVLNMVLVADIRIPVTRIPRKAAQLRIGILYSHLKEMQTTCKLHAHFTKACSFLFVYRERECSGEGPYDEIEVGGTVWL